MRDARISLRVLTVLVFPPDTPYVTSRPNGASASSDASKTLAADRVQHDVDLAAVVRGDEPLLQPLGRGVDRHVRAELQRERALVIGRCRRDHAPGAGQRPRELDRKRAGAAGGGVHDDALAGRDAPAGAQQMPGGQALQQQREGGRIVDRVGKREGVRGRNRRDLRVAAAATGQRHDALAGVAAHARDLGPGHQRQLARGEVLVAALVGVGEVHAGQRHVDQHLGRAAVRLAQLDELQHLRATELLLLDRAHEGPNATLAAA